MASEVLSNIKEEVTCPICLELLVDPKSADCGHSFCEACIRSNYESTKDKDGQGTCPVCRATYLFENLRPSRHMANIVERLKEFGLSPSEPQVVNRCPRHGEKLQLFCSEDMTVICWLCERSKEHRGHNTYLLEDVAKEFEKKLQAALQKLMAAEKHFDSLNDDIQEERAYWENQLQGESLNVQAEFRRLRDILDAKEKDKLQKLKKEGEDISRSLVNSKNELTEQSRLVRDLISDLQHRLEGSTMEMLQDVKQVLERSESLQLKKPKTFPRDKRRVFQVPDLKAILQVFDEMADLQHHWVEVTLKPNENPNIIISEDRKQMEYKHQVPMNQLYLPLNNLTPNGVRGLPALTSGKHYWEVDVYGKNSWVLGLSAGAGTPLVNVKPVRLEPAYDLFHGFSTNRVSTQYTNFQPNNGYWVIKKDGFTYSAFDECSVTRASNIKDLFVHAPLSRVGVFLDYAARTLSFYNVSSGFLLYRFSACSFPGTLFPYFSLMNCPKPMRVC